MMKFPPNWSMESILIVALAAAVIVVVFAQSGAIDRIPVAAERQERGELTGDLRRSFIEVEDTLLGR
jgi:preprotein translocase subunit SecY